MSERLRQRARSSALAIATAATALAPAWSLFDHALEPGRVADSFAAVRVAGALVCAGLVALLWRHRWGREHPTVLAATALAVVQLEVGWMLPQVDHLEGYLLGATLALYAAAAVLVGPPGWTAGLAGATFAGTGAGLLQTSGGWDGQEVLLSLLYLGTATVASYLAHALRHHSLHNELTSRAALEAEQAHTAELLVELQRLSSEDPLTGLVNRRRWDQELAVSCAALQGGRAQPGRPRGTASLAHPAGGRATGSAEPRPVQEQVALILIDVDHFKAVNDSAGHAGGDEVLRQVARIVRENVRAGDVVARLGGDELAVLLPGADRAEAVDVAERVRSCAEALRLDDHPDLRVTLSLGVAVGRGAGTAPLGLTVAADEQLYLAKAHRNTVVASAL